MLLCEHLPCVLSRWRHVRYRVSPLLALSSHLEKELEEVDKNKSSTHSDAIASFLPCESTERDLTGKPTVAGVDSMSTDSLVYLVTTESASPTNQHSDYITKVRRSRAILNARSSRKRLQPGWSS